MLKGLELLKGVEADTIEVVEDSLLVIKQLSGEFECRDDELRVYHERCVELMGNFRMISLIHVPREQNMEANGLAQDASGFRLIGNEESKIEKPISEEVLVTIDEDDWRYDIYNYLKNPSQSVSRKLRYHALKYVLLDDRGGCRSA